MKNSDKVFCVVVVAALLICVKCNPIMVYSGTRMAPITPPTPAPRFAVPFPPIPPAPVYEVPEPENNSVYRVPLKFGYRLKPLVKSYALPMNYSKYAY